MIHLMQANSSNFLSLGNFIKKYYSNTLTEIRGAKADRYVLLINVFSVKHIVYVITNIYVNLLEILLNFEYRLIQTIAIKRYESDLS